jgi:hypothetical protein
VVALPAWPHRSNDRYLVVGLTQSGKTNLAHFLAREFLADPDITLLVVDPKDDDQLETWFGPDAGPPPWTRRQVIRYVPGFDDESGVDAALRWAFEARNVLVWLDELPLVATATRWPRYLAACYRQGARRGVGCIALTQDPVHVPVFTRSQAEHKIIFQLQHPAYVDELSRLCGCDVSPARELADYHWLLASLRIPRCTCPDTRAGLGHRCQRCGRWRQPIPCAPVPILPSSKEE